MDENLKDILSNLNPDIDQETLLLYLQGKLTTEQQHEVEKSLLEDDFEAEALEGLERFKDKHKLELLVDQLNRNLKKRTEKKRRFRETLNLRLEGWLLIAVVIILLLVILSYFIMHQYLKQ